MTQWGLPFADMVAYSINTEGMGGRPGVGRHERVRVPVVPVRPRARRRADGERVPAADPALAALDGLQRRGQAPRRRGRGAAVGRPPGPDGAADGDRRQLQAADAAAAVRRLRAVHRARDRHPRARAGRPLEGRRRHRPRLPLDHREPLDRRAVGGRVHGPLDPALRRGRRDGLRVLRGRRRLRRPARGRPRGRRARLRRRADQRLDHERDLQGRLRRGRRARAAGRDRGRCGRRSARRGRRATATGRPSTPPGRSSLRPRTCSSGSAPGPKASPRRRSCGCERRRSPRGSRRGKAPA